MVMYVSALLRLFLVNFHDAHHGYVRILERLLDVRQLCIGYLQDEIRFCSHGSASSVCV